MEIINTDTQGTSSGVANSGSSTVESSKTAKRNKKIKNTIQSKLEYKHIPDVKQITIHKCETSELYKKPDFYKNSKYNTYIVFGESTIEGRMNQQGEHAAAEEFNKSSALLSAGEDTQVMIHKDSEDGKEDEDASGLIEEDIEPVIAQANISRGKAVRALKKLDITQ